MWSDRGRRVGTPTATMDSRGTEKTWLHRAMVQRRTARAAPGTFMLLSRGSVGSSSRRTEMGVGTHCWLRPSGVHSHLLCPLYAAPPMGKWNMGVKREIFKHSGVVTLSVVQLRVPGDHRSSGYLRIASLSYKFQPTTHELFWFFVRKLFPPRRG